MSVAERYDPQRARVEDWKSFFYDRRDDLFILPCIEGDVELNGRFMLINILLTMPLINRFRPISRDQHLFLPGVSGIYGAGVHAKIMTRISQSLEEVGYTREELGHDMIMTVNDAHNLCYTHLGNFVRTMDIFSMADTILQPDVKPTCTIDYGDIDDGNISRMEKIFKNQCEKAIDLLTGDTLEVNIFRAPLLCNALKLGQFGQFLVSAGPRTDTDDHVFLRPVHGSFLSGLTGIVDLAIESRSASKASHYNKSQMAATQYVNRKIHLLNSVTWHLYPGDCGSTVFLTYVPTKNTVERFLGKFYLNDQNVLTELTKERFADVVGKRIMFRDVPACLHTDGYCETCGGTITKSFSREGNVGFLSNVNTGAPVAQQVLSTKHLSGAKAAEYQIPHELEDILMSVTNDVYIRPGIRKAVKSIAFGFQPADIAKINDLKYHISDNELHAAYFSEIKYMSIGQLMPDGSIELHSRRTAMKSEANTYPHLSPETLAIIRKHRDDIIIQDGLAWFVLRNIDPDKPVMQCAVVNNSIRRFVRRFTDLVTKDVERYTSINDFLTVLTKLIWSGDIKTHVTHISCLARSSLVTSHKDFHIPVITDPDNVTFSSLNKIIPMRSIGAMFAYQNINQATNNPITYITPKLDGIFDAYMGYTDTIERDKHWPVETGSAVQYELMD